jgi:FSR family fosmidomycin resistance protein-like MFS transporter
LAFSNALGPIGIDGKVWQAERQLILACLRKKNSMQKSLAPAARSRAGSTPATTFSIVLALSLAHLMNDGMQSLLPAIYPIIKQAYQLDFGQIGLITLAFQLTASLLQPLVGLCTDRRPQPYSLVAGMGFTLIGLIVLANAGSYLLLLLGAVLLGTGSAIFHPESTRMARLASGGRHGLAQALFQVGGQAGQALGPLLAAFVVVPHGQGSISFFSLVALLAMLLLLRVSRWYRDQSPAPLARGWTQGGAAPRASAYGAVALLVLLMFSKNAYSASLGSYYTFYLIGKFHVSVQASQMLLFLFLMAQALGSLIGGHLGDRFGRREIIWFSILGALPFTLALPYANLFWTAVLTVVIGMIMASAFPAILVYALDLLPGKVGMIAGLFYGVSFGLGAVSAAILGKFADLTSLAQVYRICAFLPLFGLLTWFLPPTQRLRMASG